MSEYEPPAMHPDNIPDGSTTDQLKVKLQHSYEAGKESVSSCCNSICSGSSQLCESASAGIRRNPVASVLGAAFVGAAVCYLILEGRNQPTFRDRYLTGPLSDATDSISDSVNSLYNSLKFW